MFPDDKTILLITGQLVLYTGITTIVYFCIWILFQIVMHSFAHTKFLILFLKFLIHREYENDPISFTENWYVECTNEECGWMGMLQDTIGNNANCPKCGNKTEPSQVE